MRRNERGQPRGKHLGHGEKKKWAELMFDHPVGTDQLADHSSIHQE